MNEVVQRFDGSLATAIPAGVVAAFGSPVPLTDAALELTSVDSSGQIEVSSDPVDVFLFSADVAFTGGTRSFSVQLFEDPQTGDGYEYLISLVDARLTFDRRPNLSVVPLRQTRASNGQRHLRAGVSYHLELVADGTICTLYLDGVAFNVRIYAKSGTSLRISVVDGRLEIHQAALAKPDMR